MPVFISYDEADVGRVMSISQLLTAWRVPNWMPPRQNISAAQRAQIQAALAQADTLLRICTAATSQSYWMTLEQAAYLSMLADAFRARQPLARRLINLRLDKSYRLQPFDYADPIIDASDPQGSGWQSDLHRALMGA